MRKYFISIFFIFCVFGIYSQNYSFEVGDDIVAFTQKIRRDILSVEFNL